MKHTRNDNTKPSNMTIWKAAAIGLFLVSVNSHSIADDLGISRILMVFLVFMGWLFYLLIYGMRASDKASREVAAIRARLDAEAAAKRKKTVRN